MNLIQTNLTFRAMTWGNIPQALVLHNADASQCTVYDVHQWHLENGWSGCGYHYFVRKNGTVEKGRPDNAQGGHCSGHNKNTLGICFEGAYMKETMPVAQLQAGIELIQYLFTKYGTLPVYGHKELFNTDCPGTNFPLAELKAAKTIARGEWHKGLSIGNENKWWFKHTDGSYTTEDWELIDNNWYYFDAEGWMRTGWIEWRNNWYYCWSNGSMAKNCTAYGYKFDNSGKGTKI